MTHSMKECETLCDRVGIMINGQLACLGSNQHLKHKFGKGFQVDLKYHRQLAKANAPDTESDNCKAGAGDIELDEVKRDEAESVIEKTTAALKVIFGGEGVTLMESYTHSARYQVGTDELSIADVFEHLESIKAQCEIVNYAVSQISLEQIFLGFAKDQKPEEKQNGDDEEDERGCASKSAACVIGCCVVG